MTTLIDTEMWSQLEFENNMQDTNLSMVDSILHSLFTGVKLIIKGKIVVNREALLTLQMNFWNLRQLNILVTLFNVILQTRQVPELFISKIVPKLKPSQWPT